MSVKIRGYSDDLIDIEGDVSEEFDANGLIHYLVSTSTGVLLRVRYAAVWRIDVISGADNVHIVPCPENDDDNYSDVATVDGDVSWVQCGNEFATA